MLWSLTCLPQTWQLPKKTVDDVHHSNWYKHYGGNHKCAVIQNDSAESWSKAHDLWANLYCNWSLKYRFSGKCLNAISVLVKYFWAAVQQSLEQDPGFYRHILTSVAIRTSSEGSVPSFAAADMVRNYLLKCTLCHGNMWAKMYPKVWVGGREEEKRGFFFWWIKVLQTAEGKK